MPSSRPQRPEPVAPMSDPSSSSSSSSSPSLVARALRHRLAWPLVTLLLLLAVNAAFNPSFLHVEWRDGHAYGSLIDILNRAAPLALVSLGMTLVVATRGIDISVGAVVAISAAVAAWMIGGATDGATSRFGLPLALGAALGVALLCGLWNGVLVAGAGMQPIIATLILMVAGRGIAQLVTDGQILTIYYPPFFFIGGGHLLGLPFSIFVVAGVFALFLLAFAGIPLTSGFTGKYAVFSAAIAHGGTWLAVVGVLSSAVAAFFYVRVIVLMYFSDPDGDAVSVAAPSAYTIIAIGVGAAATVLLGVVPSVLLDLADRSALFLP